MGPIWASVIFNAQIILKCSQRRENQSRSWMAQFVMIIINAEWMDGHWGKWVDDWTGLTGVWMDRSRDGLMDKWMAWLAGECMSEWMIN